MDRSPVAGVGRRGHQAAADRNRDLSGKQALKQATDDPTLAYSALGQVLRPKGRFRVAGRHAIQSKLGLARLEVEWRTVELWTLPAEQFLAEGDVGIVPWVPLMHMDGPPEAVLERCAARIEREAPPNDRTDMLVVSQVMTQLRFADGELLSIFRGAPKMIESPLVQEWKAEAVHVLILDALKDRFKSVPRDVSKRLREIVDEKKLRKLSRIANKCATIDAFRDALLS
jgi:hypothetical protein